MPAPYSFFEVAITDSVGGVVRLAQSKAITVTDPATGATAPGLTQDGQPVAWVTTDKKGAAAWECDLGAVIITAPNGLSRLVYSPDYLADVGAAPASAAASAASAADSATSAQDAANLVGAPADTAIATAVNGSATQTRAALDSRYQMGLSVLAYGAAPDGTNPDNATMQAALDAAAPYGVPVYVPRTANPFLLSLPTGKTSMLFVQAGSRIIGPGTLKVKSGAGDYFAVITGALTSTDLTGLLVEGVTIDQNNTGNPATTTGSNGTLFSGNPRYAVYAAVGSNLTVRNCTFRDIDSVNTLALAGSTVADVVVTGNRFLNVGQSNNFHDHSTIYVSANGMTVTGNVFLGTAGGKGSTTAIETHGSGQVVTGNRVRDYYTGANVTGVAANGSDGAVVADNVFRDVNSGIVLWSQTAGTGLRQCIVHDNTIIINHDSWQLSTTDFPRGISIDPGMNVDVESLSIHHNAIWFKPSTATAQTGELQAAGIALWSSSTTPVLRNVRVESNTIVGALSAGIRWQATGLRVRIQHNDIVNPGSSLEAAMSSFYKSGITLTGTLTDARVIGNRTHDDRGTHVIGQGIQTSLTAVTRCRQGDNEVVCTDGAVLTDFVQTFGKTFATLADSPQGSRFTSSLYYSPEGNRATVATANGTATVAPFWVSTQTKFDRIGAQVTVAGVAGTVVRLGIYADNGNGTPGALILDAGTVAGDAVASAEITISQTLTPGLYWLLAVSQGGTPTMTCIQGTNVIGGAGTTLAIATGTTPRPGYLMFSVAGALPASFSSGGQSAAPVLVALRAA